MSKPTTVFVVYHEPEYEGGGSYNGVRDIEQVFYYETDAKSFCTRSRGWYDYEEVLIE